MLILLLRIIIIVIFACWVRLTHFVLWNHLAVLSLVLAQRFLRYLFPIRFFPYLSQCTFMFAFTKKKVPLVLSRWTLSFSPRCLCMSARSDAVCDDSTSHHHTPKMEFFSKKRRNKEGVLQLTFLFCTSHFTIGRMLTIAAVIVAGVTAMCCAYHLTLWELQLTCVIVSWLQLSCSDVFALSLSQLCGGVEQCSVFLFYVALTHSIYFLFFFPLLLFSSPATFSLYSMILWSFRLRVCLQNNKKPIIIPAPCCEVGKGETGQKEKKTLGPKWWWTAGRSNKRKKQKNNNNRTQSQFFWVSFLESRKVQGGALKERCSKFSYSTACEEILKYLLHT